jgi:hypothetical protein
MRKRRGFDKNRKSEIQSNKKSVGKKDKNFEIKEILEQSQIVKDINQIFEDFKRYFLLIPDAVYDVEEIRRLI